MPLPPIDALLDASMRFLQDMELAARNRKANLTKHLHHQLDLLIEQEVEAEVAHWFIEHVVELRRAGALDVKPHKVEFFDRGEKKSA